MKRFREEEPRTERSPLLLGLAVLAGLLALVIIAGSVYAFATGSRRKAASRFEEVLPEGNRVFKLGSVRGSSAGKSGKGGREGALVAAVISFPYPASEREFGEELSRKAPALRAAALSYFRDKRAEELRPAYEGAVKAGLRDAFNALLSLGRIEEVWLSDYAVIE